MNRTISAMMMLLVLSGPSTLSAGSESDVLTLREAIDLALDGSPEVLEARAAAASAAAAARLSRNALHPVALLTTTPGYASGLPVAVIGRVPAIAGFEIDQTIYDPSVRAQILQSEAASVNAEDALVRAKRTAAKETATLYAQTAAEQGTVALMGQKLEAVRRLLSQSRALREEGRLTDLEVERASLAVEQAEAELDGARRRAEVGELRLRQLLHREEGRPLRLDLSLEALPAVAGDDHLAAAVSADVKLRSLDREIEALERTVRVKARTFQPVIQGQIQYSRLFDRYAKFYNEFEENDFSVAASVVIPVWTGGRRSAELDRFRAELQRLQMQRAARRDQLEVEVRERQVEAGAAETTARLAQRSRDLAAESLRLARLLADEGRGEAGLVPREEMTLAAAEEELLQSKAKLVGARAALLALRGELPGGLEVVPGEGGSR